MKKILMLATLLTACSTVYKVNYTTTQNEKEKTLQGIINREIIESDTTFRWFGTNYKYAQPDAAAVATFKQNKNKFTMMVFGGTWCEDTQNLLPMFYKLIEKSEYPQKRITLVGVNRKKKAATNYLPNTISKMCLHL